MCGLVLAVVLSALAQASGAEAAAAAQSIGTAYEANRATLAAFGTIRFHYCDGLLGNAPSLDGVAALFDGPWVRRSASRGLYLFDGPLRRYENIYSFDELIARREKAPMGGWISVIASRRLLTDGETTLLDRLKIRADGRSLEHVAVLLPGIEPFFQFGEAIPFLLRPPGVPDPVLGDCVRRATDGSGQVVLEGLDDSARLGGVPVVKLSFAEPARRAHWTFWVDVEHGAIPLETRTEVLTPDAAHTLRQEDFYRDVRSVGNGWLPFRCGLVLIRLAADGTGVEGATVRETVLESADFSRRPEHGEFSLEFPEPLGIQDPGREVSYSERRVWGVRDFSPAARARAVSFKPSYTISAPVMAGAREPTRIWPGLLVALGVVAVVAALAILYRRAKAHA